MGKMYKAFNVCWNQSPWWEENVEESHGPLVPCPEWWSDAETDSGMVLTAKLQQTFAMIEEDKKGGRPTTTVRHWCYIDTEGKYMDAEAEAEEEPAEEEVAEDDGFLLTRLRQEEGEIEDPGNEEVTIIDLGHEWDYEWIIWYFNQSKTTKDKLENYAWENIEARKISVEENPF